MQQLHTLCWVWPKYGNCCIIDENDALAGLNTNITTDTNPQTMISFEIAAESTRIYLIIEWITLNDIMHHKNGTEKH